MESSPITKKNNVKTIQKISVNDIIDEYKRGYDIDVRNYFHGIDSIYKMECKDSGFGYYSPRTMLGDSHFYEKLQVFPWYYERWKWEHEVASNFVSTGDTLLEVGCAEGAFLQKLKKIKNIDEFGLELNETARKIATENNLNVELKFLSDLQNSHEHFFDVVCSFQVLEHVEDPIEFIKDSLHVLKQSGKLIISVPNNDSFIKNTEKNVLNMPPHHAGLWRSKTFHYLENMFSIKVISIDYEPLQTIHIEWYLGTLIYRFPFLRNKLLNPVARALIKLFKNRIKGHSIMAVFEKL